MFVLVFSRRIYLRFHLGIWRSSWSSCRCYRCRWFFRWSKCLLMWLILWWPHDLGLLHRGIGHAITYIYNAVTAVGGSFSDHTGGQNSAAVGIGTLTSVISAVKNADPSVMIDNICSMGKKIILGVMLGILAFLNLCGYFFIVLCSVILLPFVMLKKLWESTLKKFNYFVFFVRKKIIIFYFNEKTFF